MSLHEDPHADSLDLTLPWYGSITQFLPAATGENPVLTLSLLVQFLGGYDPLDKYGRPLFVLGPRRYCGSLVDIKPRLYKLRAKENRCEFVMFISGQAENEKTVVFAATCQRDSGKASVFLSLYLFHPSHRLFRSGALASAEEGKHFHVGESNICFDMIVRDGKGSRARFVLQGPEGRGNLSWNWGTESEFLKFQVDAVDFTVR